MIGEVRRMEVRRSWVNRRMAPVRRAYPRRGIIRAAGIIGFLCSVGDSTLDLHKKPCRMGPGICATFEKVPYAKFRELRKAEVQLRRIHLPRTRVNRGQDNRIVAELQTMGELRFRVLLSESGVDRLELARCFA